MDTPIREKIDMMLVAFEQEIRIHQKVDCYASRGRVGGVTKILTLFHEDMDDEQVETFDALCNEITDPNRKRL